MEREHQAFGAEGEGALHGTLHLHGEVGLDLHLVHVLSDALFGGALVALAIWTAFAIRGRRFRQIWAVMTLALAGGFSGLSHLVLVAAEGLGAPSVAGPVSLAMLASTLLAIASGIALAPKLRRLPAFADLLEAHERLEQEVVTRRQAEANLRRAKERIEARITERTRALSESETRYQLALDGSSEGIWDWNIENGSVHYSDRNRELLGLSREEFPDRFESWSERVHPEDLHSVLEIVQHHLDTRESYEIQYRIRARDGSWQWWRSRGQATWDDAGRPVRMLGINSDVTAEKQREEALMLARREAEAASTAKSAFLATMSHEIRTPMNGIIGMADLLSETALSEEQRVQVDTIIRSGEGLLTIINDVLDFSKIEAGRLTLEARPFDIADEVAAVGMLLRGTAREKGLDFSVQIALGMPRHVVGDAGRIRQVATNLLGNAIKFTERGAVMLTLDGQLLGNRVETSLRVRDTGVGIPPERQTAIFAAYEQVEGAGGERRGQGTGLGLAITRRIVEAMGGQLTLKSAPGEGSVFTCRFSMPVGEAVPRPARRAPSEQGGEDRSAALAGLSVLVAEDNATNRLLMKKLLGPAVGTLSIVETGLEAVERFATLRPDLVLMDVSMPEMDGYEATAAIRDAEGAGGRARCPIIALTANAMQGDRERCLRAGMDDFLAKPLRRGELIAMLERWSTDPSAAAVA